jgi:hypothetical protein
MFVPPFLTGQNLGNLGFNTTEKKEKRDRRSFVFNNRISS